MNGFEGLGGTPSPKRPLTAPPGVGVSSYKA